MQKNIVCSHLGLEPICLTNSLSSTSEVYLICLKGHDAILKTTRSPIQNAQYLAQWLRGLKNSGVSVVAPLELGFVNPFGLEECYVVYPFIKGRTPSDTLMDYYHCGQLLGSIWKANPPSQLPHYRYTDFSDGIDGIIEDLVTLKSKDRLSQKEYNAIFDLAQQANDLVQTLTSADLVWSGGVWDYKACNLVIHENGPVLIDPDSCGYLPRILDLALAYILWPNDCPTLAGKMPAPKQWEHFHAGIESAGIALTPAEWSCLEPALKLMFLDEALYLLVHDDAGFLDPRQKTYLQSLIQLAVGGCKYPVF